ncbi:phage terminase large subunit-like protein [Sphingorhabdus rigui]|uniref:Phage terminase large subunit-like protein n=2 Tax=Sphingorhabdus rigui TaxID=1282858 RepID=A0A840B312_9SPHN|nr:terminase family protein [Sphingorhabdus rigui]MBB3943576.1 phage terminase large subunit-like protein [Sphingorhabdus rigui]
MTQLNAQALMAMPYEQMVACIKSWNRHTMEETRRWCFWRRNDQFEPQGDWRTWLVMAGRGYGKTRMGAEWVSALAAAYPGARFALVGATLNEARQVMVEGESGLLALPFAERPEWEPSLRRLTWRNGATATLFSAAEPESLRGPQHDFAWADEIAKWPNGIKAWDNLMLGLRLGQHPRIMATTTPRPVPLLRRLVLEKGVAITRGRTADNDMHLPPEYLASVRAAYEGTRWGRQELDGELIEDAAGALWSRDLIERQRVSYAADLKRIVIGVDPPVSENGDACGIVAVGIGEDKKAYVLADHSIAGASPERWARAVAAAVDLWQADRVVAEDNQGGNMVETVLRAADLAMPIKRVHASRNKSVRAEPIAALYEARRVFHTTAFPEMEDQMCGLVSGGGYEGPGRSPDRADALVWALTELMLGKAERTPRVRLL